MKTARCFSCGAEIVWAVTTKGNRMPVDAQPSSDGNILLERRPDGALIAVVSEPGGLELPGLAAPRYKSHFATCPNASEHRRAR